LNKGISKSSELLWLLGTVFVALGVSICNKASLGVSMIAAPAFIVSEAVSVYLPWFSVGVAEYLFQGVLLLILCLVIRRFNWRYLLAFAVAIVYGYTLDLFIWIFSKVTIDDVWLRWVMLLVGDISTAFGVACFFRTYLPLQVYELFVSELSKRYNFSVNKTKWVFDISLLITSVALACTLFGDVAVFDFGSIASESFHNIGLGTIVTTAINSPIIALMGRLIDKIFIPTPLFPKLEGFLARK